MAISPNKQFTQSDGNILQANCALTQTYILMACLMQTLKFYKYNSPALANTLTHSETTNNNIVANKN